MKLLLRAVALVVLFSLGACNTAKNWWELRVAPMPIGQIYDQIEFVATSDGFRPSIGDCDRGLGIWQSNWRVRNQADGHPGRSRMRVEIEVLKQDQPGWLVRWYVEQQRVKDLSRAMAPREDDWSRQGQDAEREQLFGARLSRRLRPAEPDPNRASAR